MLMNELAVLLSGEVYLAPELNQEVLDGGLAKQVPCEEYQANDRRDCEKGTHAGSVREDVEDGRRLAAADSPAGASAGWVARRLIGRRGSSTVG
jgi:hypothetical protein